MGGASEGKNTIAGVVSLWNVIISKITGDDFDALACVSTPYRVNDQSSNGSIFERLIQTK